MAKSPVLPYHMRQIVFDTETTGLSPRLGHRIVEIGCVELIDRKPTGSEFHCYLNPERDSDPDALAIHGLSTAFLAAKPRFFEVAEGFVDYVRGATLIAHNARFDVGFLDAELMRCTPPRRPLQDHVEGIIDTLEIARGMFPGKLLNLDQVCARLGIDISHRNLHGALLDARLLARAYLALTTRQDRFEFGFSDSAPIDSPSAGQPFGHQPIRVVQATSLEVARHEQMLAHIEQRSGRCLWPDRNPAFLPDANACRKSDAEPRE